MNEELKVEFDEDDLKIIDTLNAEQWAGFDEIIDDVIHARPHVFFIDGPGGTEKTYFYRALPRLAQWVRLPSLQPHPV